MLKMLFSIIKLMIFKMFSKIPLLRSLVKLRARQIDIVDSIEQCEQIAVKFEKLVGIYNIFQLVSLFILKMRF